MSLLNWRAQRRRGRRLSAKSGRVSGAKLTHFDVDNLDLVHRFDQRLKGKWPW
jgi:hypothetical protein